jgi:predicted outer membrane repeat protein
METSGGGHKMNRQAYLERVAALAFALLALATAAQARTIYVDAKGKADCPSIQAAVEAANSGDIIVLAPATYPGLNDITGKVLTLRSQDPNDPVIVAHTIIDCQNGRYYAFSVVAAGNTHLTLAGLTICNGSINGSSGGAVQCEGADLDAINCTFRNNTAELQGAVYCRDNHARFVGCTFSGNTSEKMYGGAIYCAGSQLDLVNCSFKANKGCALEAQDSQVTLTDCTFQNNSGDNGGAISSSHSRDTGLGETSARLNLTRCTFIDNSASSCGGALYNYGVETTISVCMFTSNAAGQDGGAVYNSDSDTAALSCAFVGNTAVSVGGAMSSWYGSSPKIVNCTFVGNSAAAGGAIASEGQSRQLISHSILWSNTAPQGKSLYLAHNSLDTTGIDGATVEYSDVQGGRNGVYVESDSVLNWSSGNIDADPLFADAGHGDYSLLLQSPCVDAGDPHYVPDPKSMDLAGSPRLFGPAVDMGAYESCRGPVYRFWSPLTGRHFYTISHREYDKLLKYYPQAWTYESVAYYASSCPLDDNMVPVHRLWSATQSSHFWTIDDKEYQQLLKESPGLWADEGIAFYVYPPFKQPWGTLPVHRFWWINHGGHFFTADENEKNKLLKDWQAMWAYEGIVWYAFPGGPKQ